MYHEKTASFLLCLCLTVFALCLSAVPELENVVSIEAMQVCNVNSGDITAEI